MADNLQFDRAEQTGPLSCKGCGSPLPDQYYVVNGNVVCANCRHSVEEEWNRGGAAGRLGKAIGLGILATIACSVAWYAVIKLTDSEWGILAVVVGLVVGGAVRKGSNGRGGWRYQTLAIFLTYTAIVSSYVPLIIEAARERGAEMSKAAVTPDKTIATHDSTAARADSAVATTDATAAAKIGPVGFAVALVLFLGFVYAMPFLAGIQNVLGILIIGFALFEAWKLNRRTELSVSGPHQVSTSSAPA
jgi:hypothetical protein